MRSPLRSAIPLSQDERPPCLLPLSDADLNLGNANWTKGLQAMSEWIWSGNLNPEAFPNNLARYFLHIPGIFEQQLNFSTTLIFDEPSFKNGVQISGFLDRVTRELAISLIAQRRLCWYSMTHHAILGRLTAIKHGLNEKEFIDKWTNLIKHEKHPEYYTRVERAVLAFVDAFATNPKSYTDAQYKELRAALREDNKRRYVDEGLWLARMEASRIAQARALLEGASQEKIGNESRQASDDVSVVMPPDLSERKINSQVVELAFLGLQFVALTCVFSGLNIPDEDFLPKVMMDVVPAPVIEKINELNKLGLKGEVPDLVPPSACEDSDDLNIGGDLYKAILEGDVVVEPGSLKGTRIPMTPYEGKDDNDDFLPAFQVMADRDNGLTVGGIQVGVYGWSFGGHFPGDLPYLLLHHPELARYEAPYSLPLLFNEDEWRNGVQTAGYVSRSLKELVIQKIYRVLRTRYGIEHHTLYIYNTFFDKYGVGRPPKPKLSERQQEDAMSAALARASKAILNVHDHLDTTEEIYTPLEVAVLSWTEYLLHKPHKAYEAEKMVRSELDKENRHEIEDGLRRLDTSPDADEKTALKRLVNHQIAELAMIIGHMDGLARVLIVLHLEAEEPVQAIEGSLGPSGGIVPDCDEEGQVKFTGYFNNRPGWHQLLRSFGVSNTVLTLNELLANPELIKKIKMRLQKGEKKIFISSAEAAKTGEF